MKKRKPKLYLVGQDPAEIFDDLDKLKTDIAAPPSRRTKTTETFARIPQDASAGPVPAEFGGVGGAG